MPKDKKVKVSKKAPKKKILSNNACRITWCEDEEKLNICQAKRPIGTQITRIEFEFNTKKVKPLLEDIQEIDCSLCNFSENEIIMYLDLSKMQVFLSTGETETESAVFDKGNY
ncbi:4579_t:CDS:2 [Cetraspora pellucida]|uniref:4579_t:CDS:1 n=1 Tax=Cetraspora pellucida TaxID=1433469 RepID=A0A9N9IVG9_9GLOM|nr:4579_t:CDS:2 [Cetraspora pellucida]